jgi:hypothetical protein
VTIKLNAVHGPEPADSGLRGLIIPVDVATNDMALCRRGDLAALWREAGHTDVDDRGPVVR